MRTLDAILRGASQVVVINNPVSGIFITLSLCFPSATVGVHGVLGLVGATITAQFMRLDRQALASGLFGYNGLLVGMALATFLTPREGSMGWDPAILVASFLLGAISTLLQLALGNALVPTFKTPPFTLAFNLTLLMFLLASAQWSSFSMPHHSENPPMPVSWAAVPSAAHAIDVAWVLRAALVSVGQVFLCQSEISGALILVGMSLSSRIAASAAYCGSLLAVCLALSLGVSHDAIAAGLWGYSSCLTAIAAVTFFVPGVVCSLMAAVGVVLTILLDGALRSAFAPIRMPIGTLPFCLAGLALLLTHSKVPGFEAVPLSDVSTPEDHLHSARVSRVTVVDGTTPDGRAYSKPDRLDRLASLVEDPDAGATLKASPAPPSATREAVVVGARSGTATPNVAGSGAGGLRRVSSGSHHGGSLFNSGSHHGGSLFSSGSHHGPSSSHEREGTLHGGSQHNERLVARKLAALASAGTRSPASVTPSASREASNTRGANHFAEAMQSLIGNDSGQTTPEGQRASRSEEIV